MGRMVGDGLLMKSGSIPWMCGKKFQVAARSKSLSQVLNLVDHNIVVVVV